MLSCKEVGELLSNRLDQKLSLAERISLRMHLFICKRCSCYEMQLAFIARSAKRLMRPTRGNEGLPPLSEEVGARITDHIAQQMNAAERKK